ncbi:MAG: hypothetical protein KI790_19605, partial [Cyclobacteriaceae bacterium]|nr:hypothetical protein [Cyclobacteriaceae bacterium HetDA_MAG_MS6]
IKTEIENSPIILQTIDTKRLGFDWSIYTRTTFLKIAKKINQVVTEKVIHNPVLVEDYLLIGENVLESLFRKESFNTVEDFIYSLKKMPSHRTHNWISGKTLQSYWTGESDAKDKKLNVLLTFLGVEYDSWQDWKMATVQSQPPRAVENKTTRVLKKYYLGRYFRYYQKANETDAVIKVPFVIYEGQNGEVIAESKTVGHQYRSTSLMFEDGALYIQMKNLDWDEYAFHIYNVGIATSPKFLVGTSTSLNNKKEAIAKKNILVKADNEFDFGAIGAQEISYNSKVQLGAVDQKIVDYFKGASNNLIRTKLIHQIEDLN